MRTEISFNENDWRDVINALLLAAAVEHDNSLREWLYLSLVTDIRKATGIR